MTVGRNRPAPPAMAETAGVADAGTVFARAMARAFAVREELSPSAWAEKHRVVVLGDTPGPWRNNQTPYLVDVMDAVADERVRTITIKKGSQIGGTEVIYNVIFWIVEQRPGLLLFVYPDADSAADQNAMRFLPAARATPPIAALLSAKAHDTKSRSIRFLTCDLLFRGSFSEHKLESLPAPYVIVDELDRCPPRTAHLAAQRGKTYTWGKVIYNGKPGLKGEGVDAEYDKSDMRTYRVPCPHCGVYHERTWEIIRWHGRDAEGRETWASRDAAVDPAQAAATACVRCPACTRRIDARFNHWQLRRGRWIAAGQRVTDLTGRPGGEVAGMDEADARWGASRGEAVGTPTRDAGHAGFHIPEMLSGLIPNPYGPVARAYVERGGRMDPDIMADHLGLAWSPVGLSVSLADLRALAPTCANGGYRMGIVPEACRLLVAAVDVQAASAFVTVQAFGPGGHDRWLVWAEEVPCPEEVGLAPLDGVLYRREFRTIAGRAVPIHVRAVDSGDRTEEVYAYILARSRLVAVKGVGTERGGRQPDYLHQWRRLEVYPDGRAMRGSVHLLRVNTHVWKSVVQRRLRLAGRIGDEDTPGREREDATPAELLVGAGGAGGAPGSGPLRGPCGAWRFPEDIGDGYFRQLTAEECLRVIEKGRVKYSWRLREGHPDNHYFDCAVYAECLADALGVRSLQAAPAATPEAPAARPDAGAAEEARRTIGQRLVEEARKSSLLRRR